MGSGVKYRPVPGDVRIGLHLVVDPAAQPVSHQIVGVFILVSGHALGLEAGNVCADQPIQVIIHEAFVSGGVFRHEDVRDVSVGIIGIPPLMASPHIGHGYAIQLIIAEAPLGNSAGQTLSRFHFRA